MRILEYLAVGVFLAGFICDSKRKEFAQEAWVTILLWPAVLLIGAGAKLKELLT